VYRGGGVAAVSVRSERAEREVDLAGGVELGWEWLRCGEWRVMPRKVGGEQ